MCILFLALKQHPKYPVIICANRDEFHPRPTQAMHQWADTTNKNIVAGKDIQAGGTWLGINNVNQENIPGFQFSALTNYRQVQEHAHANSHAQSFRSRGELVVKALSEQAQQTQHYLFEQSHQYQHFNLIFGQIDKHQTTLSCFNSIKREFTHLTDGFHSICNGALDDIWPKMATGLKDLEHYVQQDNIEVDMLFAMMRNSQQAPDHLLPQTGVPLEWEQRLSSIFITSPEYGTRSTCILMLDNKGLLTLAERTFNPDGNLANEISFSFN